MKELYALLVIPLLAGMTLSFVSCSEDESSPTENSTPEYVYSGFVLNVKGQDVIRVRDEKADGKIFIYPNEIRPTISFLFLDRDGVVVDHPSDSVVVILDIMDTERFSLYPNALPDQFFDWSFSIGANRLGVTELRVSFIPEGMCKPGNIVVQAVG